MRKYWPYVNDDVLISEIRKILNEFETKMESINIYKNVVDPFSAIFDMAKQKLNFDEWIVQEQSRQSQKNLQNLVGYFHQHILGSVDDWSDPGRSGSLDLVNDKEKIIVELKNKHNTFNSSSAIQTYRKVVGHLDGEKKGYQGYVVTIIPKKPGKPKKHFAPNDDGGVKVPVREDLLLVDGATIYEIVTKDKLALEKLFMSLPLAIDDVIEGMDLSSDKVKRDKLNKLFVRAFGE
jgi:sulfur relay (sulfurtransferase) DsrC/TusE family protein